MKSKKRVISILLFISFSILITILSASPAHSTKTEPIPITKIVYNPPDPVIDDGEPMDSPWLRWQSNPNYYLTQNSGNEKSTTKENAYDKNIIFFKNRNEIILRYLINMFINFR